MTTKIVHLSPILDRTGATRLQLLGTCL
jgi:hypothetical protein